jgi:uncharacterized membrane protein
MKWGAHMGCHQLPSRSFFWRSYQFPLCARCTGVLLGSLLGIPLLFFIRPSWSFLFLFLPLILDGGSQLLGWRSSNNFLRLITGMLSGIAMLFLFARFFTYLFD